MVADLACPFSEHHFSLLDVSVVAASFLLEFKPAKTGLLFPIVQLSSNLLCSLNHISRSCLLPIFQVRMGGKARVPDSFLSCSYSSFILSRRSCLRRLASSSLTGGASFGSSDIVRAIDGAGAERAASALWMVNDKVETLLIRSDWAISRSFILSCSSFFLCIASVSFCVCNSCSSSS